MTPENNLKLQQKLNQFYKTKFNNEKRYHKHSIIIFVALNVLNSKSFERNA